MDWDMLITGALLILGASVWLYAILREEKPTNPRCDQCGSDCTGQYLITGNSRYCQRCSDALNLPPF